MTTVTLPGGTDHVGSAIARAAAGRGHEVTAASRNAPAEPVDQHHRSRLSVAASSTEQPR
ncbi:hypothetical protein AB0K60_20290 [Thermopolyspora sp. NPDC052614]|uniref:hypothetical protein n=1 Tax=Thermopolyspora sp. NPDC052614 TaxID=3155682 RepID=UPI00342B22EB